MNEPYEAFEEWMRNNEFADVVSCTHEQVDLDRLHEAIEAYGKL